MKKLLIATLITAPALALAGNAGTPQPTNQYGGLYIGAELGATHASGKIVEESAFDFENSTLQAGSDNGVYGQLDLGYRYALNQWIFGIEAFSGITNAELKGDSNFTIGDAFTDDVVTKFQQKYLLGADLQAGYVYRDNLYYVFAGALWNKIKYSADGSLNIAGDSASIDESTTKTIPGILLGLGAEQPLTDHLSLSEKGGYVFMRNATLLRDSDNPFVESVKLKNANFVMATVGLKYTFNV